MALEAVVYTVDTDDHRFGKRGDLRVKFPHILENRLYKGVKTREIVDHCTERDGEGFLFYAIPNVRNTTVGISDIMKHGFSGRIKDAVDAVIAGEGDCLRRGFFGGSGSVIRFIDRDYGEKIREKFIEGFKNSEFGYLIALPSGGFGGPFKYGKNKKYILELDRENFFLTEKEANDALILWEKELQEAIRLYSDWLDEKDKDANPKEFEFTDQLKTILDQETFISDYLCFEPEEGEKTSRSKLYIVQEIIPSEGE